MAKNLDENKKWAEVIAKAWSDEQFKEQLMKHPEKTLKEFGIDVPKMYKVQAHEEKNKIIHFYLPPPPEGEMSEAQLKKFAAAHVMVYLHGLHKKGDMSKESDTNKKWAEVITKAWTDERFKEKLLKHPEKVHTEFGIEVPKGYKIQVHEEKKKIVHFYLPPPSGDEISEEELQKLAGAGIKCTICATCCSSQ